MNVGDYQAEVNKYLRYKKERRQDPLETGYADSGVQHLDQMLGSLDDWKKYRMGGGGSLSFRSDEDLPTGDSEEEEKTEAPQPAQAAGDTDQEGLSRHLSPELQKAMNLENSPQRTALSLDTWTKASTSPSEFSMGLTPEDRKLIRAELDDQRREVNKPQSTTDDQYSHVATEARRRYHVDELEERYRNRWLTPSKGEKIWQFLSPTHINLAKRRQDLAELQAARGAAEMETRSWVAAQRTTTFGDRGEDVVGTGTGINPADNSAWNYAVNRRGDKRWLAKRPTDDSDASRYLSQVTRQDGTVWTIDARTNKAKQVFADMPEGQEGTPEPLVVEPRSGPTRMVTQNGKQLLVNSRGEVVEEFGPKPDNESGKSTQQIIADLEAEVAGLQAAYDDAVRTGVSTDEKNKMRSALVAAQGKLEQRKGGKPSVGGKSSGKGQRGVLPNGVPFTVE